MTQDNRNLVVGLLAGFAWGLVVCSLAHAEPLGGVHCAPGYAPVLSEDRQTCTEITIIASCEQTMAEAMRAMEKYIPKFVDPAERRRYADGQVLTDDLVCRSPWCYGPILPDTRTLAERLRDTQREYERNQERLGRQIVEDEQERWAYRQWESSKSCWRNQ